MSLSFRTLAIGIGVMGIAFGVAFGAGVAYGRGDPKTIQSGLSQAQIQQLYGASTAGGGAGAGAASGAGGAGAPGAAGAGGANGGGNGAAAAAAARSTTGRVTAVTGQTVTIDTARGSQKVNLTSGATVSKITGGTAADITEGTTIFANGTRKDDGSFDATSISQISSDVAALLNTLTGGAGAAGGAGATATPTR